jgi:hypothetical protein
MVKYDRWPCEEIVRVEGVEVERQENLAPDVENKCSLNSHSADKGAPHSYAVEDPAREMAGDCPTHDLIYTLRPVMTLST